MLDYSVVRKERLRCVRGETRKGFFLRWFLNKRLQVWRGSVEKLLASLVCVETAEPVLACSWDRARNFQQWSPFCLSLTLFILWDAFHWCVFQTELRKGVTVEWLDSLVYTRSVGCRRALPGWKYPIMVQLVQACVFCPLEITQSRWKLVRVLGSFATSPLFKQRPNKRNKIQESAPRWEQLGGLWKRSAPAPRPPLLMLTVREGKPGLKEKCWEPREPPSLSNTAVIAALLSCQV